MEIPKNLKYTKTHEWIRTEKEKITVGITEHAQAKLTDIVYVELPKIGMMVEKGGSLILLESVKAVADVYAPATGKVIAVNDEVQNAPELINKDPYGKGWLVTLKIENEEELKTLLSPEQYEQEIKK